jgi:2,3-bisphosphoglycerate-independent phosphoglycerate mutase
VDITKTWEDLSQSEGGRIVYIVLDGLGGLHPHDKHGTALEVAATPNLDRLAKDSVCGRLELVGPGITPGSGPGHLSLFGYDPFRFRLGRGVLSALGIDFPLKPGDVAARVNFALVDKKGRVIDRRADRIKTETNLRLCKKVKNNIRLDNFEGEFFFETVSKHRAVLILRNPQLGGNVTNTDPEKTGVQPYKPKPRNDDSKKTAQTIGSFISQTRDILDDEDQANMVLTRGIDRYKPFPTLKQRFKLSPVCVAAYPMYRGVSRLLGMSLTPLPKTNNLLEASLSAFEKAFEGKDDFFFIHFKKTDSYGEDGNFAKKVETLEAIDHLISRIANHKPDVLVVTGDHSTPAVLEGHSWHPVPVIIHAPSARIDAVRSFDEYSCISGSLGLRPGIHLMGLALAHAGRLRKFGA